MLSTNNVQYGEKVQRVTLKFLTTFCFKLLSRLTTTITFILCKSDSGCVPFYFQNRDGFYDFIIINKLRFFTTLLVNKNINTIRIKSIANVYVFQLCYEIHWRYSSKCWLKLPLQICNGLKRCNLLTCQARHSLPSMTSL